MNEIRFNNQNNVREDFVPAKHVPDKPEAGTLKKNIKKISLTFVYLFIVIIVCTSVFFGYKYFVNRNNYNNPYVAVFLSNGQVYFGKIVSNKNNEMVLNNVYYLKDVESGANQDVTQSITKQLSIIKLGTEIHGPTDFIFINKQNILFYEELRDNSKVVETINNQKNN